MDNLIYSEGSYRDYLSSSENKQVFGIERKKSKVPISEQTVQINDMKTGTTIHVSVDAWLQVSYHLTQR